MSRDGDCDGVPDINVSVSSILKRIVSNQV